MKAVIVILAGLAALAPAWAQKPSPFADKPCASYSGDGLKWGDAPLNDFGPRQVAFDLAGVRKLRPAPPPGVHPRILCTPEDLPEIARRLKETRCGQQVWRNLLCWTEGMKGRYNDQDEYAKPDLWHGTFGGLHGPVPLFRLGKDGWKSDRYRRLIAGDTSEPAGFFWSIFPLEALRCQVENDAPAARDLARAVITAMKSDQAARAEEMKRKKQAGPPDQPVGGVQLAWTYDFLYRWLTDAQRQAIHDELAETTWRHDNYGTFTTATTSRSNWASFSYWLIELLAIEGEPGFNDLKYRGMYRGWRNFLTYGFFPSGAVYEGEAKDQLGMDGIIAFAMRGTGENLCGHPHLRAYADRFLPHSMLPQGGGFVQFDLLGGMHNRPNLIDALGLKYMLPDDRRVDWVYRNCVGEEYLGVPDRPDGYFNGLLFYALFATDFDPANNDPAKLDLGETYFAGDRGLLLTRSGWGKDALMLGMHTRGVSGGHAYADRNSILLAGSGRVWATVNNRQDANFQQSLVTIDGKPQGSYVPGRIVDFLDNPQATFVVGDAKYAWDWMWKRLDNQVADARDGKLAIPAGWEPERHSDNDFAYTKHPDAYLNEPQFTKPSWIGPVGSGNAMLRQPNVPVQKAFRTAGLVRGKYPYALVVDDIRKDDAVHHYDWALLLDDDVQVVRTWAPGRNDPPNTQLYDVFLAGGGSLNSDPKERDGIARGEPMLLVRVLSRSQEKSVPQVAGSVFLALDTTRRLVIPSDSVSPDYRVLLYPYRQGDPLPKTLWDAKRATVTVELPGQKDEITFSAGSLGKTNVVVRRLDAAGPKTLAEVTHDVPPLQR